MLRRQYLPIVVVLVGAMTAVGPPLVFDTDPAEEFPVYVHEVNNPERYGNVTYENLSADGQRAFDRARENNGSATVSGEGNVPPEFQRLVETEHTTERLVVTYGGERYLMEMGSSTSTMGELVAPLLVFAVGVSTTVAGLAFVGRSRPQWSDIVLGAYLVVCLVVLAISVGDAREFLADGWLNALEILALVSTLGAGTLVVWRLLTSLQERLRS